MSELPAMPGQPFCLIREAVHVSKSLPLLTLFKLLRHANRNLQLEKSHTDANSVSCKASDLLRNLKFWERLNSNDRIVDLPNEISKTHEICDDLRSKSESTLTALTPELGNRSDCQAALKHWAVLMRATWDALEYLNDDLSPQQYETRNRLNRETRQTIAAIGDTQPLISD